MSTKYYIFNLKNLFALLNVINQSTFSAFIKDILRRILNNIKSIILYKLFVNYTTVICHR